MDSFFEQIFPYRTAMKGNGIEFRARAGKTFRVHRRNPTCSWPVGLPRSALRFVLHSDACVCTRAVLRTEQILQRRCASKTSPASNFTLSQSSPSTDDTILLEQQMCLLAGNIDRLKAMSLAVRSLEFHVLAGGHEVQFDGIFLLFSEGFDSSRVPGSC